MGGMIAFAPFSAKLDEMKSVLMKLFELGAVAFYCGHDPYLIRILPPMGVMTEEQVDQATALIEQALLETRRARAEQAK